MNLPGRCWRHWSAWVIVTLMVWPHTAWACAVCFDARAENRWAFIGTTALLTLLPLICVGGGAFWLYRRARST